ncbi:MAG: DinB family protein [Thermomicrobiales bacterium]
MHAATRYAQRTLDAQAERIANVVNELPPEALAWRPGDETTNAIAQIVRHVVAWQPWYLGVALGDPVPLDDEALNQKQADSLDNSPTTAAALRALVETTRAQTAAALERMGTLDLDEEIEPYGDPEPRSFYLSGAIDHAAEHIGHAELTRQLWEQRH